MRQELNYQFTYFCLKTLALYVLILKMSNGYVDNCDTLMTIFQDDLDGQCISC